MNGKSAEASLHIIPTVGDPHTQGLQLAPTPWGWPRLGWMLICPLGICPFSRSPGLRAGQHAASAAAPMELAQPLGSAVSTQDKEKTKTNQLLKTGEKIFSVLIWILCIRHEDVSGEGYAAWQPACFPLYFGFCSLLVFLYSDEMHTLLFFLPEAHLYLFILKASLWLPHQLWRQISEFWLLSLPLF